MSPLCATLPEKSETDTDTAFALIVDDSATDRVVAGRLVERLSGLKACYAANGKEALSLCKTHNPSVILTDLRMPQMDGLELVEALRCSHPDTPVILMTAVGSEEIALAALRAGAISYVPKRRLQCDLTHILPQVLNAAQTERRRQRFIESIQFLECRLAMENDPAQVPLFVAHIQEYLLRLGVVNRNGKIRVGVALEEALLNGMCHGNLEVSSELRQDGSNAYRDLVAQRSLQSPYAERRLHVHATLRPEQATFVIRDEGPGFDPKNLPDPTDPENMTKASGRGLLLIHTFMDEVRHNEKGNEITLVKRRAAAGVSSVKRQLASA